MTILRHFTAVAASLLIAVPAFASDSDHFKGHPANTLEQAIANFSEYNNKLDDEIDALEDTLEKVHKASERADTNTVRSAGQQYLSNSREIVK